MKPLTPDQQSWINRTLASLSPEHRLAQLLIPKIDHEGSVDQLVAALKDIPFGGLFVWGATAAQQRERIGRIQAAGRVPVVVCADLENGPGYVISNKAKFPDTLAVAAAVDEHLAYAMGQAAAVEGRAAGIHWTFAPIVDVNVNPDNPIANSRSLGDDPDRIARFATAILRGMQDHGLAACAKHFPGDGIDDADQHVCTTVNSLPMERWKAVSGRTFAAAFAADVMTVMVGHIALPAWDGERDRRGAYRPATLSRKITTDLLRREMGFDGLVVTDDMNMGGAAGYMNRAQRTVACIAAGCDMLLFPWLPQDFDALLAAMRSGELPRERVDEACRRVLEFKARLGLHTGEVFGREATAGEAQAFERAAREMAERAIVCVRDVDGLLPLKGLKPGARVLTVTLTNDGLDLPEVDQALRERGYVVEHIVAQGYGAVDAYLGKVDAIFVNLTFRANWCIGTPRCTGPHNRMFMNGFYLEHPRVVFTSFGSPYHLRQFSTFPNYINTHSQSPGSQRAAVAAWFGEIPMSGTSPVGNLVREFHVPGSKFQVG